MAECKFKVGDKIVSNQSGTMVCATVLKIHGNGFIDVDVFRPKAGKWENIPSGNWSRITKQVRCNKPPQS